jgi:RHS repeat-associated protein
MLVDEGLDEVDDLGLLMMALHRATRREPRGRRSPPVARALTPLAGPTTSSQHVPGDRAAPPRTIARRSPSDGRTRIGPVCLYGYDAHRNIGFLTDGTGAETDTYTYDAWGNLVGRTGSTLNTRLFAGEELDPDLGLLNLRARQYTRLNGRFLTGDPTDEGRNLPNALDRYLFANCDPVDLSDPTGRDALEYAVAISAGVLVVHSTIATFAPPKSLLAKTAICVPAPDILGFAGGSRLLLDYPPLVIWAAVIDVACSIGIIISG